MAMVLTANKVTFTPHYRPATFAAPPAPRPTVTDDYERWYTEANASNRMLLSLRSGIHSEIGWALDRLCRLCDNEQFLLKAIPGLTDALFEWPHWYTSQLDTELDNMPPIFAPPHDAERRRRHALESLFILRNSALNEPNAMEVASHPRTYPLILQALQNRRADLDQNTEFILYAIELLQAVAFKVALPTPASSQANVIQPLERIAGTSMNRTLIIASLSALSSIASNFSNAVHLSADSPALLAAIRYLPLLIDKPLIEACLNYLYIYISQPALAKAFLLHPDMPCTLRLLVSLLRAEQVEETVTVDVGEDVISVPAITIATRDHELTQEELDSLLESPEPQRCYEWMKAMFVAKPQGELTQVDFWNLYKDVFTPFQDRLPLLVASDVIKNVTVVFPQAQAMVLPGPPQKFVVRGVDRRKETVADERFRCQWDRAQCSATPFKSAEELYEHLQEHIRESEGSELACLWMTCQNPPLAKHFLRAHVLTHLSSSQPKPKPPSQSDTINLPSDSYPHPTSTPTHRPPPLPAKTTITYKQPVLDPPSTALTALLCIRILFRASFASTEAAPRADADHFGFPLSVEEADDQDMDGEAGADDSDVEAEGERRGRKAFLCVRSLMESIQLRDEVLMAWIAEMVEAGLTGRND